MCYHKSLAVNFDDLMNHYSASFASIKSDLEELKVPYLSLKPRYETELKKLQEEGLYDPLKTLGRQKKANDIMKQLFTLQELDFVKMYDKMKGSFSNEMITRYHENGYDYLPMPIITNRDPNDLKLYRWGFIPWWVKDYAGAKKIMADTLNCKSEEMFNKPSWKDALKNGQRCLVPFTGFYEWRHMDEKGKTKIPFYISTNDQGVSSFAGLFNTWKDPETGSYYHTYTVITTEANKMMAEIHNSAKRMPVIISKEHEREWLNPNLSKDQVLELCRPYDTNRMEAHTVSQLIGQQNVDTNVLEVLKDYKYEGLNLSPYGEEQ